MSDKGGLNFLLRYVVARERDIVEELMLEQFSKFYIEEQTLFGFYDFFEFSRSVLFSKLYLFFRLLGYLISYDYKYIR